MAWPQRLNRILAVVCMASYACVTAAHAESTAAENILSADAEIVLDEYTISDRVSADVFERTMVEHRIVRVLTAAGAASQGTMSIPYATETTIDDLLVLCTSPDGRKVEVRPEQMFDRAVLRLGKIELRERSFPLPGIVPGSKIEYRLQETTRSSDQLLPLWLSLQRDLPIRELRVSIRPWGDVEFTARSSGGATRALPFTRDESGRLRTVVKDLPPYHEEPYMPSEVECRLTVLGIYGDGQQLGGQLKLQNKAGQWQRNYDEMRAYSDSIGPIAHRVTNGIDDPEARARALLEYCRRNIRNTESGPDSGRVQWFSPDQPKQTLTSVLKQRVAPPAQMSLLYAALAQAAGFEVHLGWVIAPGHLAFDSTFATATGFAGVVVMLRHAGGWWYCDPGDHEHAFGVVAPELEGAPAVFTGGPRIAAGTIPRTAAGDSRLERRWDGHLRTDGTLECRLRVRATGQVAQFWRQRLHALEDAARYDAFVAGMIPERKNALRDSSFLLTIDPSEPAVVCDVHVRIPDYAQRAGSTWLVPPTPFSAAPLRGFDADERRHPLELAFAWTLADEVHIDMPEGAKVETASREEALDLAEWGGGTSRLVTDSKTSEMRYERSLTFGARAGLRLPAQAYAALREANRRAAMLADTPVRASIAAPAKP